MPWIRTLICVAAICTIPLSTLYAQRGGKGVGAGGAARGAGRAAVGAIGGGDHVLMRALDTDSDGVISAKELRAAVRSLKKLDVNRDGTLTADELRPGAPMPGAGGATDGFPKRCADVCAAMLMASS